MNGSDKVDRLESLITRGMEEPSSCAVIRASGDLPIDSFPQHCVKRWSFPPAIGPRIGLFRRVLTIGGFR